MKKFTGILIEHVEDCLSTTNIYFKSGDHTHVSPNEKPGITECDREWYSQSRWLLCQLRVAYPRKSEPLGITGVEIFAAFINGLVLIGISVGILYEAIGRLSHPAPINGGIMFFIAAIGLCMNIVVALKTAGDP